MKELFKIIKNKYKSLDTLDKKMFWYVAPFLILISVGFSIGTFIEGMGTVQIVIPSIACIASFSLMIAVQRTGNYTIGFPILAVCINCFIIPVAFFFSGGFFSGVPLVSLTASLLCAFCADKVTRILTFLSTIVINVICFIVAEARPELVMNLPSESVIHIDIIVCYIGASLLILFLCNLLMEEFNQYTMSKIILNQYMDFNVQKELFRDGNKDAFLSVSKKRSATILLADISNFTAITEGMEPEMAAEYLNIFLAIADKCIHENGGTLDKYIGDCAMAFWIDEKKNGYGVMQACKTAFDIRHELSVLQETIFERFGWELNFTAGINYGEVVAGGIGSARRKDYTIIGSAVNTTQRIQDVASSGSICVSDRIKEILGDAAECTLLVDKQGLKGKTKPVSVYTLNALKNKDAELPVNFQPSNASGNIKLHICGSRGSYSVTGSIFSEFGGETSCYILKKGTHAVVIDCGTGLYKAKQILEDCEIIDIILTHVHYDHILGLLDWSVFPAGAKLTIYGNFDKWEGKDTINNLLRAPFWPVNLSTGEIVPINFESVYELYQEMKIRFYPASHPNESCFVTIDVDGNRITVLADCEDPDVMPREEVRGSSLVIYDGMYEDKEYEAHRGWGHSSWERGIRLAMEENVGRIIITHHNPHYSDQRLRELELRAKGIFPAASFARAGDIYSL